MNFFAEQDRARTNTGWLVIFLSVAVAGLIFLTTVAVAVFVYVLQNSSDNYSAGQSLQTPAISHISTLLTLELFGSVAAIVLIIVAGASLYKLIQLARGGKEVAHALGGRLINTDTRDADERKLLNVVEEMAIASGNPVPPVYLLEEQGINAFAAGFDRQDAVIGVTRGCIQQLSRDELQGVIAHEFSHIHFGDMRLNMRLVALLHGILIIGLIGYFLMRSSAGSRRREGGAQVILGLALIIIGYCGTFFGSLIKSAVSRQREYLADASAVQFTRNPAGIAGALKKIGGWREGSQLQNEHAAEYSHLYFGNGVKSFLGGLLATHPPLEQRIKRIEPGWNGRFERSATTDASEDALNGTEQRARSFANTSGDSSATATGFVDGSLQAAGNPTPAHIAYARGMLDHLPPVLRDAAHEPYSARAIVYALLLHASGSQRQRQLEHLRAQAHPATFRVVESLNHWVRKLQRDAYLPLIELSIPALKQLSPPQYQVFKKNMAAMIRADKQVSLFEWSLYRIVAHAVEERRPGGRLRLRNERHSCQILLSVACYAGKNEAPEAAYAAGLALLNVSATDYPLLQAGNISFGLVDKALTKLASIAPLEKPQLLKAIVRTIETDGRITAEEAELFRAIADSLNCPLPPMTNTTPTQSAQQPGRAVG